MTTSLEVLNACLRAVGERPVTDYNSLHPTALSARQTIQDVNNKFQSKGWWFNKEYNLTLQPLVGSGDIVIPSETLEVTPQGSYAYLVRRGNKLYDPVAHTFHISNPVTVTITILLPIDDMPSPAGNYLKAMAKLEWSVEEEVDASRIASYREDVRTERAAFMNEHYKLIDLNSTMRPVSAFLKQHMQPYGNLQYDATYPGGEGG